MKIKHWIIPNKKNKFHPHALRPLGLSVVLLLVLALQPIYNLTATGNLQILGYATNITINDLHALSNQQRVNNGVHALSLNAKLNSAALAKAHDMMEQDYWAHVAPDGTTPWYFITSAGYQYTVAGENLAMNFYTSSGVVSGWMNSPGHRDNLLNVAYQDVGYAVLNGILQGDETTLVVAMYGSEYVPPPPVTTAPDTPPAQVEQAAVVPAPVTTQEAVDAPTTSPEESTDATEEPEEESTAMTTAPTAKDSNQRSFGSVLGSILLSPINAYISLNWAQKATLLIMSVLILLFIMKHTLVWREQRRGLRHIWLRSHPIGQASLLLSVLILTLLSSVGVVL